MQTQSDQQYSNIYLLADWEKDLWKKVYFTVGKKAIFMYTFDKADAKEKNFELNLGEIFSTTIKAPKRKKRGLITNEDQTTATATNDTKSSQDSKSTNQRLPRAQSQDISEAKEKRRRPEYSPVAAKRVSFSRRDDHMFAFKVFDQDQNHDAGYDSAIDETREPFYIKLFNKNKHEVGQLKCSEQQPLKNLRDQIQDARQQLENLGLPLTIEPHDCHSESFLNKDEIQLRGMVNLLVLLLLTYHLRGIVDSFTEHDFVLFDVFNDFINSGFFWDPRNYLTLAAGCTLISFPACAFIIELLAGKGYLNETVVVCLVVSYLSFMLVYPIILIQWIGSGALPGTYLMLFAVSFFLKLTSFHHVCYDNRYLMRRIKESQKPREAVEDLATLFNVNENTLTLALKYPDNLSIWHYLRFLLAPTCCYQLIYPTSPSIRIGYLFKRLLEFFCCYWFMWYLIYQHMIPIASGSIVHFKTRNYLQIVLSTLHMAVPASYLWLVVFYSTFHSWLNFLAELTQFADRRFYSDWWNAGNLGEYWRKWNQPIHNYLLRHIYFPCRRFGLSSSACLLITFTISAVFHEYIVAGIFSILNFVAFFLMMINIPCMMLQRQLKNVISANTNNMLFWLAYVIFGQPFGFILVYYQMIEKSHEAQVSLEVPFPQEKFDQIQKQINDRVVQFTQT